jgi:lipoate-protein ligase A
VDAVRRPTGGRALLHDREVTYAVTAPIEEGVTLGESFRGINALLADALARLGVQVRPAERGARATRPGLAACFAEPSEGELTVDGAKLVGSAQWRDEGALLQHGSILLDDDQARIASLLEPGVPLGQAPSGRTPAAPVATLNALLGRQVDRAEVAAALLDALADRCRRDGVTSPALVESHSGTSDAMRRHLAHFTDASWTWRR